MSRGFRPESQVHPLGRGPNHFILTLLGEQTLPTGIETMTP